MGNRRLAWLAILLALSLDPLTGEGFDFEKASDEALNQLIRLPPRAFPFLTEDVQVELERRGCQVPQATLYDPRPHNVISGEFGRRGQTDWAIVCFVDGRSRILVFWGGAHRCAEQLHEFEDRGCFQNAGDGIMADSCVIAPADEKYMTEKIALYGWTHTAPVIDHDGIDDIFAEKASVVHYCNRGAWLELPGAD